jgi:hypothetical protein
MCSADVYREKHKEAPKKPRKLKDFVRDDAHDVEYICASARLAEVGEILGK